VVSSHSQALSSSSILGHMLFGATLASVGLITGYQVCLWSSFRVPRTMLELPVVRPGRVCPKFVGPQQASKSNLQRRGCRGVIPDIGSPIVWRGSRGLAHRGRHVRRH